MHYLAAIARPIHSSTQRSTHKFEYLLLVVLLAVISVNIPMHQRNANAQTSDPPRDSPTTVVNPKFRRRIDLLTAAIQENPGNINLYNSRGWYYFQNGDYALTLQDYDRVIQLGVQNLDPFYQPVIYYVRGISYSKLGENDSAIESLQAALQIYQDAENKPAAQEVNDLIMKIKSSESRDSTL